MPHIGRIVYITPTTTLENPSCLAYEDRYGTTGPVPKFYQLDVRYPLIRKLTELHKKF